MVGVLAEDRPKVPFVVGNQSDPLLICGVSVLASCL
jgi:hypothetical protein